MCTCMHVHACVRTSVHGRETVFCCSLTTVALQPSLSFLFVVRCFGHTKNGQLSQIGNGQSLSTCLALLALADACCCCSLACCLCCSLVARLLLVLLLLRVVVVRLLLVCLVCLYRRTGAGRQGKQRERNTTGQHSTAQREKANNKKRTNAKHTRSKRRKQLNNKPLKTCTQEQHKGTASRSAFAQDERKRSAVSKAIESTCTTKKNKKKTSKQTNKMK